MWAGNAPASLSSKWKRFIFENTNTRLHFAHMSLGGLNRIGLDRRMDSTPFRPTVVRRSVSTDGDSSDSRRRDETPDIRTRRGAGFSSSMAAATVCGRSGLFNEWMEY
ncbi:hypothetical protein ISCGN_007777 [Ixodes scapularis]